MKLDSELGRLTVEHGTMRGPPTEQELVEESSRKQLAHKVGLGAASRELSWPNPPCPCCCCCWGHVLQPHWGSPGQRQPGNTLVTSWGQQQPPKHRFLALQLLAEHADSLQVSSSFEATINNFDNNFSAHLLGLLDKLSIYSTNDCEHSMINIIYR